MDIQEVRKENLKRLVDQHGLAEAARIVGKPDRQVNDMLKGRKSFGYDVARDMEQKSNGKLPDFYFDDDKKTIRLSIDDRELLELVKLVTKLPVEHRKSVADTCNEKIKSEDNAGQNNTQEK